MTIDIQTQIACAKREVAMRQRVYPNWVEAHRMSAEQAEKELAGMRAIVKTLEWIAEREVQIRQYIEDQKARA